MDDSRNNHLGILDLPDEILLIILQKINIIDVLDSVAKVNRRFDRLVVDPLCIRHLDMTNLLIINSLYDHNSSIDTEVLSSICQNILPRIHHHIHQLTVEQYSMKSILRAADYYPQLHLLSLLRFQEEVLYQYLTDDLILRDLIKQITHLNIDITKTTEPCSTSCAEIFALILSLSQRLIVLNFCDLFLTPKCWVYIFSLRSTGAMSSTLTKLKINVDSFLDCLYLLDGRLDSLSTLIINVSMIFDPIIDLGRTRKLPKLKCLSFTSFSLTGDYDELIVPLLCRMINLEQLTLYLSVMRLNSTFIDGIQLYDQFLIHMTQLDKFTFNIKTTVFKQNVMIELQSNEEIQRCFIGKRYQQVASHVDTTLPVYTGECHIYSLPFDFEYFVELDNSSQGGMFDKVRYLEMSDGHPFERRLFQRISRDFPSLQILDICNDRPQMKKNNTLKTIRFPHLTFLDLKYAHVDYAKQFLLAKNTHLPRLLNLCITYKSLRRITKNFTKDATQFNFGTLKSIDVCEPFVRPENFRQYFPHL